MHQGKKKQEREKTHEKGPASDSIGTTTGRQYTSWAGWEIKFPKNSEREPQLQSLGE